MTAATGIPDQVFEFALLSGRVQSAESELAWRRAACGQYRAQMEAAETVQVLLLALIEHEAPEVADLAQRICAQFRAKADAACRAIQPVPPPTLGTPVFPMRRRRASAADKRSKP